MTRLLTAALLVSFQASSLSLRAQDADAPASDATLEQNLLYREAIQAYNDHLPEVAASKLEKLLAETSGLGAGARKEVDVRLCETLVRSGQNEKVVEHTEAEAEASDPNPLLLYWRAVALANLRVYSKAQSLLEKITAIPTLAGEPWFDDALLTRVSILRALGAPGEALSLLQKQAETRDVPTEIRLQIAELQILLNRFDEARASLPAASPADARVDYLDGRIALGEKRWDDAIRSFRRLSSDAKLSPRLRRASAIGLADALDGSAQRKEACDLLLRFVSENQAAKGAELFPMFERLDAMEFFAAAEINTSLMEWARSENPDLAALASYFVAVSQISAISRDAAIASFRGFVTAFPDHFLVDRARLRLSELYTEVGDKEKTLETLAELENSSGNPAVQARIAFLRAQADYAAGDFKNAADRFASAGAASNAETRPMATFNAALAAMKAENAGTPSDVAQETAVARLNLPDLSGEFLLERGLFQATRDVESAMRLLTQFAAEYPEHSRVGEAHLALASLFLLEFPPKAKSARAQIDLARERQLGPALSEEADYIAIWIEESDGNFDAVVSQSSAFLNKWPTSPHASEVLMKQAELYLRNEDFANAQIRFEILADRHPNAPEAEAALFFAGKAAMRIGTDASMEEAISFWEKLAQKGGEFALAARQHQAIVKRIQNKDSEAIALFDAVLSAKPQGDLLYSVLCAKGETMFRVAEATPDAMAPVIAVFRQALDSPDIPEKWRNQCLYRLGESFEKAGDPTRALEAYYDCVNSWKSTTEQMPPAVYEWFYRCGHAAMRILEARENWPASIAIARRVGSVPGQRSQEALEHARQLELKHIIWDES